MNASIPREGDPRQDPIARRDRPASTGIGFGEYLVVACGVVGAVMGWLMLSFGDAMYALGCGQLPERSPWAVLGSAAAGACVGSSLAFPCVQWFRLFRVVFPPKGFWASSRARKN